tara:strand:- start:5087 stop:6904 length:1818 start_codon:yes stop_codon:yes gene_type:complete
MTDKKIAFVLAGKCGKPGTLFENSIRHNEFFLTWPTTEIVQHVSDKRYELVLHGVSYLPANCGFSIKNQANYFLKQIKSEGIEAALQLKGHYCLFVLDKDKNQLFFAGDPNDGRRVFFSKSDKGSFVASKLNPMVEADFGIDKSQNIEYREFSLIYGYHPNEETLFQSVKRISPQKFGIIDLEGRFSFNSVFRFSEGVKASFSNRDEAKKNLNNLLIKTCEASLKNIDKVAVLLGGFDSALIAAMAKRLGKQVKAYTFKYENSLYDQANIDNVVDFLEVEHEWIEINSDVFLQGLIHYSSLYDRPTNWPNYVVQSTYLTEVAKQDGYEVVLTGDGCDEAFLGYPGIYRGAVFFSKNYSKLERKGFHIIKHLMQKRILEQNIGHVYRLVLRVLSNLQLDKKMRLYFMFRIMDENTLKSLFDFDVKTTEKKIQNQLEELMKEVDRSLTDTILAYEGREHIIPNKLKLTGMMDATGLPVYSPFLHEEVRVYVRQFPEEFLRPFGESKRTSLGKYILLEMAEELDYLPHEVIYQAKHAAVDGPLDSWYAKDLREIVKSNIKKIAPVKNDKFLERLLDEKSIDKFYRRKYSVDNITSHAASILTTYGSFF